MKEIKISCKEKEQRLDKFLFRYFNRAQKSFIYKMLRKKRIKLNGKRAEGNEILNENDILSVYFSEETINSLSETKKINEAQRHFGIVYEDDDILVVDKPAGVLTHPNKAENKNTLVDQIIYYLYQKGEYNPNDKAAFTPAVCNRLDTNTGGIVMAGKNIVFAQALNKAIAQRKIRKFYITMVHGEVREKKEFFGYHIKDENTNSVKILKKQIEGAEKVFTNIKPISVKNGFSLLEVELITGKTHQIRAHLKSMGYQVVGDRKYGDERVNRIVREKYGLNNQFLYANRIVFDQNEGVLNYMYKKELKVKLPNNIDIVRKAYFE